MWPRPPGRRKNTHPPTLPPPRLSGTTSTVRTEHHRQWHAVRFPEDGRKDARNTSRNNWLPINHHLLHLVGLAFIYHFSTLSTLRMQLVGRFWGSLMSACLENETTGFSILNGSSRSLSRLKFICHFGLQQNILKSEKFWVQSQVLEDVINE
jgi:hypothetical protein